MTVANGNELAARQGEKVRELRGQLSREDFVAGIENIITAQSLYRIEAGLRRASDKVLAKIGEKYGKPLSWFYDDDDTSESFKLQIHNEMARLKIMDALQTDPELIGFWESMVGREDLKLMFKQVKDLSPESIRRLIRVIKAIEDEESGGSEV
ncbi:MULTISPECIES: helix-turn-helix transcriptional regulator [Oscillospiraceae]|uniref:Helix-turn-helix domain protein n=1 Tax=Pseudobacteroides cellulosolvens ATCC 35603 = DSM 2933 TaxID=398512 RepID=A0A0L6JUG8_9FIRM|nr:MULTISPECIES: helix-turn-helix transcriptional regulator [Oscillospiraceae]KNY29072.1 helix-turn-helix domain protein [Pseudobacteroides cellulosolvens ATCC 35603 = DSM 2933]